MLEYCFLPLSWNVDPVGMDRSNRNVSRTISTCTQPVARVVERETLSASLPRQLSVALEIAWWLKRWERSTSERPEPSRSHQEDLCRTIQQELNLHAATATLQLIGPVRADRLTDLYDWTIAEQNNERIILEAIPRDEMDRLFYRALRVSLAQDDGTPEQINVIRRNQQSQIVWKSNEHANGDVIRVVHFEEDLPPPPEPLVRTANLQID